MSFHFVIAGLRDKSILKKPPNFQLEALKFDTVCISVYLEGILL